MPLMAGVLEFYSVINFVEKPEFIDYCLSGFLRNHYYEFSILIIIKKVAQITNRFQ